MTATEAGRVCPLDYRLSVDDFTRVPTTSADVLYIAGGLYGNVYALDAIEKIMDMESQAARLVLNGDYHWFDAANDWFEQVHERTSVHDLTRGNVETELSQGGNTDAGCGCAYPDSVPAGDVDRSNKIMAQLGRTAQRVLDDQQLGAIATLPATARYAVNDIQVAVTHGDDQSISGWSFAQDQIANTWQSGLAGRMLAAGVQVFASSHTCLPVADTAISDSSELLAIINNGSAGMANFQGNSDGLITRIASIDAGPSPVTPIYSMQLGSVQISAVPVRFDMMAWLDLFQSVWPTGSSADISYIDRIRKGPSFALSDAARGLFEFETETIELLESQ
jgi:hypothetical protein